MNPCAVIGWCSESKRKHVWLFDAGTGKNETFPSVELVAAFEILVFYLGLSTLQQRQLFSVNFCIVVPLIHTSPQQICKRIHTETTAFLIVSDAICYLLNAHEFATEFGTNWLSSCGKRALRPSNWLTSRGSVTQASLYCWTNQTSASGWESVFG